jgi:hypothetical protein
MATPGQFVRALASVLGIPEETVTVHDRNLLAAGLRSKRGRGSAAPSVTTRDAAHLVTAILGSAQVKESAATVHRYVATRARPSVLTGELYERCGIDELAEFPLEHSFVDALEGLFFSASAGSFRKNLHAIKMSADEFGEPPSILIEVLSPGTDASIAIGKAIVQYVPLNAPKIPLYRQREIKTRSKGTRRRIVDADLEQHRDISEKTIARVAELLVPDAE